MLNWLDQAPVPQDVREFWSWFGHEVINKTVKPYPAKAFMPYLERKIDFLPKSEIDWARANIKFTDNLHEGLNLDSGFAIGVHVDQYCIFVTSLLYMPPDRSRRHMGTILFRPKLPALRTLDTTYVGVEELEESVSLSAEHVGVLPADAGCVLWPRQ